MLAFPDVEDSDGSWRKMVLRGKMEVREYQEKSMYAVGTQRCTDCCGGCHWEPLGQQECIGVTAESAGWAVKKPRAPLGE